MTDARAFRGFRFPAEVILWAVRWYLQFPVSYRDLEAMLADRGVAVDHTTMYRWVQRFAPELGSGCAATCAPAAGHGTLTRRTSGSAGNGATCTAPSMAPARRSTSGSVPSGTRKQQSAFSSGLSAGSTPATRARS